MTALNWALEKDVAYLTADTLALSMEGEPRSYMSKLYPVPHLQGVITGTGIGQLIVEWFSHVQNRIVARDIHHLDQFTPAGIREVMEEGDYPLEEASTTIYHFGWSNEEDRMVGFAYRSTEEFESERLDYGFGIKPQLDPGEIGDVQFPDWFVELMAEQRERDLEQPPEERVGVGGEVHAMQLGQYAHSIHRAHRFEDYESNYRQMVENLP